MASATFLVAPESDVAQRWRLWHSVGTVGEIRDREVVHSAELGVWVVAGPPLIALVDRSTHLGGQIVWCESASLFWDEAHGSLFDRYGVYLDGPAPRGLDRLEVRVVDGVVEVAPRLITPGPFRGEVRPQQPAGPLCADL